MLLVTGTCCTTKSSFLSVQYVVPTAVEPLQQTTDGSSPALTHPAATTARAASWPWRCTWRTRCLRGRRLRNAYRTNSPWASSCSPSTAAKTQGKFPSCQMTLFRCVEPCKALQSHHTRYLALPRDQLQQWQPSANQSTVGGPAEDFWAPRATHSYL